MKVRAERTPVGLSNRDISILSALKQGKNGTRENRVYRVFCDLLLLNDFKSWVQIMRKKYKVPKSGFSREQLMFVGETAMWLTVNKPVKKDPGLYVKSLQDISSYIKSKKYFNGAETDNLINIVRSYIFFADIPKWTTSPIEIGYGKDVKGTGTKIKILFSPDIRTEELHAAIDEYLERNYVWGRDHKIKQRPGNNRVRTPGNFERDVEVYNLYVEFLKGQERSGSYLEPNVTRELKRESGIELSEHAIKKIIERMNRKISKVNLGTFKKSL